MLMHTSLEIYNHILHLLKTEIIFYFDAVLNATVLISIKKKRKMQNEKKRKTKIYI